MTDATLTESEREQLTLASKFSKTFTLDQDARDVLLWLERKFFYGKTTLHRPAPGAPIDPYHSIYAAGQLSVVLEIKAQIEKARAGVIPLPREATPSVGKDD